MSRTFIGFKAEQNLKKRIDKQAKAEKRNRSDMVRLLCEDAINQREVDKSKRGGRDV